MTVIVIPSRDEDARPGGAGENQVAHHFLNAVADLLVPSSFEKALSSWNFHSIGFLAEATVRSGKKACVAGCMYLLVV